MAGQLGYCGLDRQRRPLRGDEIRGCWEAAAALAEVTPGTVTRFVPAPIDLDGDRTPVRRLEFVEVRTSAAPSRRRAKPAVETAVTSGAPSDGQRDADAGDGDISTARHLVRNPIEPRWSLWGEEA